MATVHHLKFLIMKFLVQKAKMHHHTKFRSNGCKDIAFNVFQKGGRLPSWIFLKLIFEHSLGFGGPICINVQNFIKIGRTVAEI